MPVVSVILLTYNRAYCLSECIEAIINQTFKDWELIVCDDCSGDRTDEVVTHYAVKDRRIRYQHNSKNKGVPSNRNIGIKLSKAPLILFIEDDVTIAPDYLKTLLNAYYEWQNTGVKVGAVGGKSLGNNKQGKLLSIEQRIADKVRRKLNSPVYVSPYTGLIFHNFTVDESKSLIADLLPPWSLFNKQALLDIGLYDEQTYNRFNYSHEESDIFIRLRQAGYTLIYESKAVSYHNHASKGGTRTTQLRYLYYFVGAHMAYLIKNFKLRALYMIPCCLGFLGWNGLLVELRTIK